MPGRDFFDDDLLEVSRTGETRAGDVSVPEGTAAEIGSADIGRLVARRQKMSEEISRAAEELERLRLRQEELERERKQILEIQRKQDSYLAGKNELLEKLNRSLVSLEREEIRASQLAELLADTRRRFKELLGELEKLDEESWDEDSIREELDTALAIIEDVRLEYNRSIARVEAARGETVAGQGAMPGAPPAESLVGQGGQLSFGRLLKMGLALSLPVIVVVLLLALAFFVLRYNGMV